MSEIQNIKLCNNIFALTDVNITSVRKYYNIAQEEIDRDCEIIKEWMKQQSHFPDDYDKRRIERLLLRNKFRVERTKQKLESYYTIKGENLALLKKMDPQNEAIQATLKTTLNVPLPKLMNGTDRIYVFRFGKIEDVYKLEPDVLFLQGLVEMEILYDYAVGVRFIVDYEDITMTHIKGMEFNMIMMSVKLYQECLSGRFLSIEFINLQSVLNIIMNIFKLCLPEKLYNKIRIHNDVESLQKCISPEYLPREYGGELGSMYDIFEDVKELYMQNRDFLMNRVEMVSNENRRVGGVKKNELFGMEGTFKKINLD